MNREQQIIDSRINQYINFLDNTESEAQYSALWKNFSQSFSIKNSKLSSSTQRGYGINTQYKYRAYKKVLLSIYRINSFIDRAQAWFSRKIIALLGVIGYRNQYIPEKYGFNYPADIEKRFAIKFPKYYKTYIERNKRTKWLYSHNSLKASYYLSILNDSANKDQFEGKRILEIGAGLCNFAILSTYECESFQYIIIDLPELIPHGYQSVAEHHRDDVEIFLPHEIESFQRTEALKKVIFLLPSQIRELEGQYDLFVNHESFSEMDIKTVNKYLDSVYKLMKSRGTYFLVNKYSRSTGPDPLKISNWTNFADYKLDGIGKEYFEIDGFRALVPKQRLAPNVVFIGTKQ